MKLIIEEIQVECRHLGIRSLGYFGTLYSENNNPLIKVKFKTHEWIDAQPSLLDWCRTKMKRK